MSKKLTPADKVACLRELADVMEKYGVDFNVYSDESAWEPGLSRIELEDSYSHILAESTVGLNCVSLREVADSLN